MDKEHTPDPNNLNAQSNMDTFFYEMNNQNSKDDNLPSTATVEKLSKSSSISDSKNDEVDSSQRATKKENISENPIQRYKIISQIGSGGMGKVYKAFDNELQRTIAIKVILGMANEQQAERFSREAKAMAQLRHPNIICLYEVGALQEQPYFSMELIEGGSLKDLIKKKKRLPGKQAAEIMVKIAQGISYAHQQGIIHRDIKPENILLRENGDPVIMDFGLAKFMSAKTRLTKSVAVMGTLAYMSPEQANGINRDVDDKTDIYALGAVLYEMLTGHQPFIATNQTELMMKIFNELPPRMNQGKIRISESLEAICFKSMAKNKKDRYTSAVEMYQDLERYLKGEPVLAQSPNAWMYTTAWLKRNAKLLIINTAILTTIAIILGIYFSTPPQPPDFEFKQPPQFIPSNSNPNELKPNNSKPPNEHKPPNEARINEHRPPNWQRPPNSEKPVIKEKIPSQSPYLLPKTTKSDDYPNIFAEFSVSKEGLIINKIEKENFIYNGLEIDWIGNPKIYYTRFNIPQMSFLKFMFYLDQSPKEIVLELSHLSSAGLIKDEPGGSPINILVNDQLVAIKHSPYSPNFVIEFFDIKNFVRTNALNSIDIRYIGKEMGTHYWLRSATIRAK